MRIILVAYFTLVVHEILHILGYKICGFGIKFVYIFPIVYKGKAPILRWVLLGLGGLVVPDINDVEEKCIKKKLEIGIIAPLVFHIFMVCICVVLYIKEKSENTLDLMLLSILFFLMTTLESNGVYGDTISAFHMIKGDSVSDKILDGIKNFECNIFYRN